MGKGLNGLIIGGAVGFAVGILVAPRAGKETRKIILDKSEAVFGFKAHEEGTILGEVVKTTKTAVEAGQHLFNVTSKGKIGEVAKEASEKGQQFFKDTSEKGQKFVKDTTSFVEDFANDNVRPIFSQKNEELRQKIDTARSKIASQVVNNLNSNAESDFVSYNINDAFRPE